MATRFEPTRQHNGFDPAASWQFIGLGESRVVQLIDGPRTPVLSSDPYVAQVVEFAGDRHPHRRNILVRGLKPGVATLTAGLATLDVCVGERLKVSMSFHLVSDAAGHRTNRKPEDAEPLLRRVNEIYLPQTNIEFVSHGASEMKVRLNLGGRVAGSFEWLWVTAHCNSTARCRVLFVWGAESMGATQTVGDPHIIIRDNAGWRGPQTLAHEAGHSLGQPHSKGPRHWLMHENTCGLTIPKAHALELRKEALASR